MNSARGSSKRLGHAVRRHLTYANAMSTIAVFIGLGGASYAALKVPAHSVGANQLKAHAVTPRTLAPATVRLFKGQTGAPGPQGRPGEPGAQGSDGTAGRDGTTIVAHVRSSGDVTTADNGDVDVPLAGNTWTQQANEVDTVAIGRITFTPPNVPDGCPPGNGPVGYLSASVYVDGRMVNSSSDGAQTNGTPHTGSVPPFTLAEPGSPTAHTVTVKVSDLCQAPGDNFHVTDLKLDVESAR